MVSLGNNDSVCGDYETTPRGPFLRTFAASWKALVDRHGRAPGFAATFPELGAYQARLPFARGRAVVVNSVYWSRNYRNRCGGPTENPAAEQLAWLARTARRLPPNSSTWLVTHIPPGVDVFASQGKTEPVGFLKPGDLAGLLRILGSRAWALEVTGHVHMNTYRLAGRRPVPVMVAPSITPVFQNNPAYFRAVVTGSGQVANYTAYVLRLNASRPAWAREYSFNQAYALHGFNAASLAVLQRRLNTNASLREKYISFYNSESGIGGITQTTFHSFWCGAAAMTGPAYSACLKAAASPAGQKRRPAA